MRIALDHDSTLAATTSLAFELLDVDDKYDYPDISSWEWGIQQFGKDPFLHALWHAWTIRPTDVPLMDESVPRTVNTLTDYAEVDIVTHHPSHEGISAGKKEWLLDNGIGYDDFVVVDGIEDKVDLGYDIYVDDHPELPAALEDSDALPIVYDQLYNRDIDASHKRIDRLSDAFPIVLRRKGALSGGEDA